MIQTIVTIAAPCISFLLMRVGEYFLRERRERRRQAEDVEKLRQEIRGFHQELENLRGETREYYMLALKCVITNKELNQQARLDAYDRYKKLGGNSWVDAYALKYLRNIEE
jgi:hypothetical protein